MRTILGLSFRYCSRLRYSGVAGPREHRVTADQRNPSDSQSCHYQNSGYVKSDRGRDVAMNLEQLL